MGDGPLRLNIIIGSVREGRFGPKVAHWYHQQAKAFAGFDGEIIDLADYPLPAALAPFDPPRGDVVDRLGTKLADSDAFCVVTPEYNHSFPASLKHAIDHFRSEWSAKPVALVSYGGLAGGLRAAEHLRLVFAELHAPTIREMVSFHNAWSSFDPPGNSPELDRAASAVTTQLRQLEWWARHLRHARITDPYAF